MYLLMSVGGFRILGEEYDTAHICEDYSSITIGRKNFNYSRARSEELMLNLDVSIPFKQVNIYIEINLNCLYDNCIVSLYDRYSITIIAHRKTLEGQIGTHQFYLHCYSIITFVL